jgi:transposase
MSFILSSSEVEMLTRMYKKERNKHRANRINIILLFHKGYSGLEISSILNIDQDTVCKWKRRYQTRTDDEKWLDDFYQPYFGKLSCYYISLLRSYIRNFFVGDKNEILFFIENSFSVSYTESGLNKLLHRTGHSFQTIHKLPGKCPIDRQQTWINAFDEKLKNMDSLSEVILFMDSVHPTHNTVYCKVWSEKGLPRWIHSNTGRNRLNISGAYNPMSHELVMVEEPTVNEETTIHLLKKCLEKYPDKKVITIYLDNAAYHKSKEVKKFIAEHSQINLSYLPPYSPNLNLIERLWKFANEKVINLKYYPDFDIFKKQIVNFYNHIAEYADELEKRITFNFQTFKLLKT